MHFAIIGNNAKTLFRLSFFDLNTLWGPLATDRRIKKNVVAQRDKIKKKKLMLCINRVVELYDCNCNHWLLTRSKYKRKIWGKRFIYLSKLAIIKLKQKMYKNNAQATYLQHIFSRAKEQSCSRTKSFVPPRRIVSFILTATIHIFFFK